MSNTQAYSQTDYLDRAKKLRATAAEVRDQRVIEVLTSSAEAYEQMATWLMEFDLERSANASQRVRTRRPFH